MCKFTQNQSFRRLEVTATQAKPTFVGCQSAQADLAFIAAIYNSEGLFLQNWDAPNFKCVIITDLSSFIN